MKADNYFLQPSDALFQQALHHHLAGHLTLAEPLYRQVLEADPDHADAHNNLGNIFGQVGRFVEAAECFRQALRIDVGHANAHYNLGTALAGQKLFADAIESFRHALLIEPMRADARVGLGQALGELGRVLFEQLDLAGAADCYRQALALNPDLADLHNNLGTALVEQGQLAEAGECFRRALRLKPDFADAHSNLANQLLLEGRLAEAGEELRQALAIDADHQAARWSRACFRLLHGDLAGGWPDYERRWEQPGIIRPAYAQPRWDGSRLEGKTILVHAEQGYGDTIQFARYLPMVKERGGTVLFECPRVLASLFSGFPGVDQLITSGKPLPYFDVHVPLLSLPGLFGTTLATIPCAVPYIHADLDHVEQWRTKMKLPSSGGLGGARINVGIAWQGNPLFSQSGCKLADRRRSITLAQFEPLARIPGVQLFSLQKGHGSEQLADWQSRLGIVALGDQLDDFRDTAAVMMNLDLIISVDSAPVHLAGALGRPVWAILPSPPCWRWLLERSDSPWYPTLRLFRQHRPGDWPELLDRVSRALAHVGKGSAG